jgi:hypothetical protein
MVMPLADLSNNAPDVKAPMIRVDGKHVRAPDLMATTGNQSEYWEVKYRSRASVYDHTGDREHWMSFDCAADYLHIQTKSQIPVWIILYEAEANNGRGQWLQIDIAKVWATGRPETKIAAGYDKVRAWCWPRSAMTPVDGPSIAVALEDRLMQRLLCLLSAVFAEQKLILPTAMKMRVTRHSLILILRQLVLSKELKKRQESALTLSQHD